MEEVIGSNPICSTNSRQTVEFGALAQLIERGIRIAEVASLILACSTKEKSMTSRINEVSGAGFAHDLWFTGPSRDRTRIAAIGHSASAAYAESALAAYELGLDTTQLRHERVSAAELSAEIYAYIANNPDIGADEADTLGDLAGTLARASEAYPASAICEEPSGYRDLLTEMADEALSQAPIRLFR